VTTLNGTFKSFLTLWPADAAKPTASNLNWVAGQAATPNGLSVGLSDTGQLSIFNNFGNVDVIIDIQAYMRPAGGAPGTSAGNWGVMDRNTVGSPVAQLRGGPNTPTLTDDPENPIDPSTRTVPPFGTGSLGLSVAGPGSEKVAYGNEVDFFSTPFDVTQVGYFVYNLPENINAGGASTNMPSITFEINPNTKAPLLSHYSSLVYVPAANSRLGWSDYIDGTTTGLWGLSSSVFNGTPCSLSGSLCTWAQILDFLDDGGATAQLFSVAISKGTDFAWHGAVDGLRINNTVYDFEEHGVVATPCASAPPAC